MVESEEIKKEFDKIYAYLKQKNNKISVALE